MILDPNSIKYHLENVLYLAKNVRPGPVWLDIPFYFYNNPELAIPICAIDKQEIEIAQEEGIVKDEEIEKLQKWREDPENWM